MRYERLESPGRPGSNYPTTTTAAAEARAGAGARRRAAGGSPDYFSRSLVAAAVLEVVVGVAPARPGLSSRS